MKDILKQEVRIGNLALKNRLIAAPMAGLSSLPYRMLAMENGCSLAISEMVSAEGAIRGRKKTSRYFTNDENIRPFGVQVFGTDPQAFVRAIESFEGMPIDLVDINSGCPVNKVCKKGAGSALMKDPPLIGRIVRACKKVSKLPITLKIRSGWSATSINCIDIAKIAEDAGADAIAIHPRTRAEMFKGKSNWKLIAQVKKSVSIPVIGNGDVKTREDALRMLDETACDAVMIGRAAVGNPWIFRQILEEGYDGPTKKERGETAIRHLNMMAELVGSDRAVSNMKAVIPWYSKGIPGVRDFMRVAMMEKKFDKFEDAIASFFGIER